MVEIKEEKVKTEKKHTLNKKYAKSIIGKLKQVNEKFTNEKSKKSLLEDSSESYVYLQVTLKKIPPKKLKTKIRVNLPNSLMTDTTEVCLITGDLEKSNTKAEIEPTVLHYKELLQEHDVTGISAVVPLRQLRTEYKTYESKRQLSNAYDMFISDKKISNCLPQLLGKKFFEKRKFPIQIDLKTKNLKDQFEKAFSQAMFDVTCRGNSCTTEIARLSMEDSKILENIMNCVEALSEKIPGKWDNVNGLYLKTAKSEALPIYMSYENPNEIKVKVPRHNERVKAEELSTTIRKSVVKVFRDGKIIVKDLPESGDEETKETETVAEIKKEEDVENQDSDNENVDEPTLEDVPVTEAPKSKIKKRKSKKSMEVAEEESLNEDYVKPKRKRKSTEVVKGSSDDHEAVEESASEDVKPKNKKKKNKELVGKVSDNETEAAVDEKATRPKRKAKELVISATETEEDKPKTKRRKTKELAKDTLENEEVFVNEVDVKPKNQKKAKKLADIKIEACVEEEDSKPKNKKKSKKSMSNTSVNEVIEKDSITKAGIKPRSNRKDTRNSTAVVDVKPKLQKRKTKK